MTEILELLGEYRDRGDWTRPTLPLVRYSRQTGSNLRSSITSEVSIVSLTFIPRAQWQATCLTRYVDDFDFGRQMQVLRDRYCMASFESIYSYLRTRFHLVELLAEGIGVLEDAFPQDIVLLEISDDPEEDRGSLLCATVLTSSETRTAARVFELFESGWWLGEMSRAKGELFFNLGFR